MHTNNCENLNCLYLDWGTTNCRVYGLDSNYFILWQEDFPNKGILFIKQANEYELFFKNHIEIYRKTKLIPVYISGMAGAAIGWHEAVQLTLPIDALDLKKNLLAVPNFEETFIIGGAKFYKNETLLDVMRGEEIQVLDLLEQSKMTAQWACLPGTHSKWVYLEDGKICYFKTNMTGEFFTLLGKHSILSSSMNMEASFNQEAFEDGLVASEKSNNNLLYLFFTARLKNLSSNKQADKNYISSYVSGILVGYEVSKMKKKITHKEQVINLISSRTLATPYKLAFDFHKLQSKWIDAKVASILGLQKIIQKTN